MLELKDGATGKQTVEILGIELDGWQRDARLDASLELEQLDLKIRCGREVRLFLFEFAELGDFSGLRSGDRRLRFFHGRNFSRARAR
jgi:hypothetical protein